MRRRNEPWWDSQKTYSYASRFDRAHSDATWDAHEAAQRHRDELLRAHFARERASRRTRVRFAQVVWPPLWQRLAKWWSRK
jgi:hypothetical protein